MNKHVLGLLVALVVVLSACGTSAPESERVTLETLPAATEPRDQETTTTVAETSSTTTTTTTVASSAVSEEDVELTWAEEGTPEADVERAFWKALTPHDEVYEQDPLDPNYPPLLETHTGDELERIQSGVQRWIEESKTVQRPEPTDTTIKLVQLLSEDSAALFVCEHDRGELYREGELIDDRDIEAEFTATFTRVDGVWLWSGTTTTLFEPLADGGTPSCL